jgi:uncharacterized damage-inducible protein DinB
MEVLGIRLLYQGVKAMDRPRTSKKAKSLQRLTDARQRLMDAMADLDSNSCCNTPVAGDWTVKDMLGHIVSWNEEFRSDIELILQGQHPGYDHLISGKDDFDDWNQRQASLKRNWTWQRILDDLDRDYEEAVALIERLETKHYRMRGVSPWKRAAFDKLAELSVYDTDSIETLVTFHWRHMNQHAAMIENWRKQLQ